MTGRYSGVSQRLVTKGALVEDTYEFLAQWDQAQTLAGNLNCWAHRGRRTIAWTCEVTKTLRHRFHDSRAAQPLIAAAKVGLPLDEWRSCLLLFIAQHEVLYRRFAVEWLAPEYWSGRTFVRSADLQPFLRSLWAEEHPDGRGLTDYGLKRTASDLVRMATQLGVLTGDGAVRRYRQAILTDRCFLYHLHVLGEDAGAPSRALQHPLWAAVLMDPADVEAAILRLHQFRRLEYHAAGSLVQLTLPCGSAREFAERMVA